MTSSFDERLNQLKNSIGIPSLCLGSEDVRPADKTSSFWGGMPYQPDGVELPQHPTTGHPLTFIAQINFADITRQIPDVQTTLPAKGLLQFFSLEPELLENLEDPADTSLRWYPDVPTPVNNVPTASNSAGLPNVAHRMTFTVENRVSAKALHASDFVTDVEASRWRRERSPVHQLQGEPDVIQYDPRAVVLPHELRDSGGQFRNLWPSVRRRREQQMDAIMAEWELLWQIDWDEQLEYYWFDGGRVYIMVKKSDLQRGDLSNLRVEIQTY